jgi:hypothetical protein
MLGVMMEGITAFGQAPVESSKAATAAGGSV